MWTIALRRGASKEVVWAPLQPSQIKLTRRTGRPIDRGRQSTCSACLHINHRWPWPQPTGLRSLLQTVWQLFGCIHQGVCKRLAVPALNFAANLTASKVKVAYGANTAGFALLQTTGTQWSEPCTWSAMHDVQYICCTLGHNKFGLFFTNYLPIGMGLLLRQLTFLMNCLRIKNYLDVFRLSSESMLCDAVSFVHAYTRVGRFQSTASSFWQTPSTHCVTTSSYKVRPTSLKQASHWHDTIRYDTIVCI